MENFLVEELGSDRFDFVKLLLRNRSVRPSDLPTKASVAQIDSVSPHIGVALKLPTRMVLGSNLAIISLASLTAFVGKLWAGQISGWLAVALVVGAIPGAQVGAALSHRVEPKWLRRGLALMVGLAAIKLSLDALG